MGFNPYDVHIIVVRIEIEDRGNRIESKQRGRYR